MFNSPNRIRLRMLRQSAVPVAARNGHYECGIQPRTSRYLNRNIQQGINVRKPRAVFRCLDAVDAGYTDEE